MGSLDIEGRFIDFWRESVLYVSHPPEDLPSSASAFVSLVGDNWVSGDDSSRPAFIGFEDS